ncbi:MAG: glycine/sarcosine/betaine reductase component B subunit [Firmicutes bacterium]|nr:glycine/sarcosine/betaine reductase component B subunit [Bacillota bacterium]
MNLELGYIKIKDIKFADKAEVKNGVLSVSKKDLEKIILEDENFTAVDFDIAKPGESVRITPVKDVIEPRCKVSGGGDIFPGVVSKVHTVGTGRTHVLSGMAVVTTGAIVGFQEGIIDMSGVGADYTPFSKTLNLCINFTPKKGLHTHTYEESLRKAGLKVAYHLGKLGKDVKPDEIKSYEYLPMMQSAKKYPNLPRVGYVQMLQSQGLLHDTYVYGVDMKQSLTTMISPLEIFDGAILSGNCVSACDKNTTYHHQNNPVIEDLFEQHGKTINFCAMIITNENVFLADKIRSSDWTAKIVSHLDLDGVIISQEGFGNPDTDLIMNCKKVEGVGVKTVIITDEYAGREGTSQSLADADPAADAVVTGGNANQVITLPKLDKVIGTLDYTDKIAGGFKGSLNKKDGTITVEIQAITGATNELGFNKLSAR